MLDQVTAESEEEGRLREGEGSGERASEGGLKAVV
jgi:hypothetical protein